jgi:glycosyltransferase involved in cell wall biosynthesis
MSYAKPVIGCGVGGVPEVIQDEVTGKLVPPADVSCLVNAIIGLLKDSYLAQRLGFAARQRVEKYFNRDVMIRNTIDVYRQVLNGKR